MMTPPRTWIIYLRSGLSTTSGLHDSISGASDSYYQNFNGSKMLCGDLGISKSSNLHVLRPFSLNGEYPIYRQIEINLILYFSLGTKKVIIHGSSVPAKSVQVDVQYSSPRRVRALCCLEMGLRMWKSGKTN